MEQKDLDEGRCSSTAPAIPNNPAVAIDPRALVVTIEKTVKERIPLDIEFAARWFCALSDEQQADFFIEVAREAATWDFNSGHQWWLVGRHLRNCDCSTIEARELVEELHRGLVPQTERVFL